MNNSLQTGPIPDVSVLSSLNSDYSCFLPGSIEYELGRLASESLTTPYSITGVVNSSPDLFLALASFTCSFDYKDLEGLSDHISLIKSVYSRLFFDDFIGSCTPINGYLGAFSTAGGSILCYSAGRTDFCLSIPQSFIEKFDLAYCLMSLRELLTAGGRVTRFDLPIDDFAKSLPIKYIYDAKINGEFVSRITDVGYGIKNRGSKNAVSYEQSTIGARVSNFFCRYYDKFAESKGKIDCFRFEMELKDEFARACWDKLLLESFPSVDVKGNFSEFSSDGFRNAVFSILSSKIDFRDPFSNPHKSRRVRMHWWDTFLNGIPTSKITLPKVERAIDKAIDWVRDQVSTTLAVIAKFAGRDFSALMGGFIEYGKTRLKKRHMSLLYNFIKDKPKNVIKDKALVEYDNYMQRFNLT